VTEPIYAALVKAQSAVKGVGNDSMNQHHKYKYTSAEALIREGRLALTGAGLALIEQTCTHHFAENGETVALTIAYLLVHETGAMVVGPWTVPVLIGKGREVDKAEAAARTYALGYTMRGLLMIDRPGEDAGDVDQRDDRDSNPRERMQEQRVKSQLAECVNEAEANAWIDAAVAKGTIARIDKTEATLKITRFAEKIGADSAALLMRAGLIEKK
jgi:hypothetical protein